MKLKLFYLNTILIVAGVICSNLHFNIVYSMEAEDACHICFEELPETQKRKSYFNCVHTDFHEHCIVGWMNSNNQNAKKCPDCRASKIKKPTITVNHSYDYYAVSHRNDYYHDFDNDDNINNYDLGIYNATTNSSVNRPTNNRNNNNAAHNPVNNRANNRANNAAVNNRPANNRNNNNAAYNPVNNPANNRANNPTLNRPKFKMTASKYLISVGFFSIAAIITYHLLKKSNRKVNQEK